MSYLVLGKNPFRWFATTFKRKGPLRVAKLLWHIAWDPLWDLIHGTETLLRIPPHNIETDSDNRSHATMYGATRAWPLMKLFRRLGLSRDTGFVDLGSGKGRVLLIAALYGFKRITGVEFSESLCQLACKNLSNAGLRRKVTLPVTVVHSDVVDYAIQSVDSVFFLYDPFSSHVLKQVLENLRQSLLVCPREVFLIYNSPRHHGVVVESGLFPEERHIELGGSEFTVYSNARISVLN